MDRTITLLIASAKDPPLIDLDSTVFVQLAIFLIATFCLSRFLFRPFLQVRAAREEGIEGARDAARRIDEEARARMADYEASLARAKLKANDERARLRAEAAAREREIGDTARARAQATIEDSRRKLEAAEAQARREIEPRADEIARTIARKVLGREVA